MEKQITRNNHYVPVWYQRGFLARKQHKLHVLNLSPQTCQLPHGGVVTEPELDFAGPKSVFCELDLYTTRFGSELNDEIEKFLFGAIDRNGSIAVRAWASADAVTIHKRFRQFFEYLDAQKLRTPKGLDWIQTSYAGLAHLDLMKEMQSLRQMHSTMWSECVREIVSAKNSKVKFLFTDHPVTIYNSGLPPESPECAYPSDPGIDLVGSQTVFPLDAEHCLILTNLEYAQEPKKAQVLARRTNARYRGQPLAKTDAFVRSRFLTDDEVIAINLLVKARAKKLVAAGASEWLYPEESTSLEWSAIGRVLLPKDHLWGFGGEVYVRFEDGSTMYRDAHGHSSRAHENLRKEPRRDLRAEDPCGCGGGRPYGECCASLPDHKRPSWSSRSIRERNLVLCRGVRNILGLENGRSWTDVRRDLTDKQVKEINELFTALWPLDTQLADLLPRPHFTRSRALYMGLVDARTLQLNVAGVLPYFDEIVMAHPFINAKGVRPEFSPITTPHKFKEQTLRNVFILLLFEDAIDEGRIHLIPDPLDYNEGYREEIKSIIEPDNQSLKWSSNDEWLIEKLIADERMQMIKRLPEKDLRAYVRSKIPDIAGSVLDATVERLKRELEDDPLALLQSPRRGEEEGNYLTQKAFARETGLFIATLTGSVVVVDSDAVWHRLHEADGTHVIEQDDEWQLAMSPLTQVDLHLPEETIGHTTEPPNAIPVRRALQAIAQALWKGQRPRNDVCLAVNFPSVGDDETFAVTLEPSIPVGGFRRRDVTRLLLTFGAGDDWRPVPLALLLKRRWLHEPLAEQSDRSLR